MVDNTRKLAYVVTVLAVLYTINVAYTVSDCFDDPFLRPLFCDPTWAYYVREVVGVAAFGATCLLIYGWIKSDKKMITTFIIVASICVLILYLLVWFRTVDYLLSDLFEIAVTATLIGVVYVASEDM